MPASTLQVANPQLGTVSRRPQTTAGGQASDAPFARSSRQAQILGPSTAGNAFGALLTPILKPVGGYLRFLSIYVQASGGNGGGTPAVAATDAPWSVLQNVYLRDPFGQMIYQADGYSGFLINIYSGQSGMLGFGNSPTALPSFSAVAVSGNFLARIIIPLELDSSGYGSLPSMNAASQPQITVNLGTAGAVFTTSPAPTVPTLTVSIDEPFWTAPVDNPGIAPPDVGSSAQWSVARAAQGVASAAFQRIVLPRVGTFIHTLILVLRDSTNARIDQWPTSDLQLWVDGVPLLIETFNERADVMFERFGVTRPTGVICYTFRNSAQSAVSSADTYDLLLPTTPATLLEVVGTFGTIASAPATITAITGELFPVGGIPYTHLAA